MLYGVPAVTFQTLSQINYDPSCWFMINSILITIIFSQLQSKHDSYELFLFHNCIWIPQWCLMLHETMHYHLAVKWYFQLAKAFYSCWWTKRAQQHCEKLYEHRKFLRDIIKKIFSSCYQRFAHHAKMYQWHSRNASKFFSF